MENPDKRSNEPLSVLLVEDDQRLADLIVEYMGRHGVTVRCEGRGDRVLKSIEHERPALVILDLMLPGQDGFSVCRDLRAYYPDLPIMMLTARDDDSDHVLGLELGADNYLQKPIEPSVLLAHMRALLRRLNGRSTNTTVGDQIVFGRLVIDKGSHCATLADKKIDLSGAEFDLLWLFAQHAGQVLSRDDILQHVRNLEYDGINRSVDYRVFRLRKKLGDIDGAQEGIKTVRGAGYLFVPRDW